MYTHIHCFKKRLRETLQVGFFFKFFIFLLYQNYITHSRNERFTDQGFVHTESKRGEISYLCALAKKRQTKLPDVGVT